MNSTPDLTSRLVQLCDGRRGLRTALTVTVREPAAGSLATPKNEEPILDFVASNETLDRYDEILSARCWRLENYRRNPVFQNAHQYGDILHTLGRALIAEVRTETQKNRKTETPFLFQRIQFAVDVNPIARIAYGLYRGGFLNAVSVGFIPLKWEDGKAGSACRRKFLEQELLEVSAVAIPANPDALQLGLKAGAIEKADLLDAADRIHALLNGATKNSEFPAVSSTHAGASGARDDEAQGKADFRREADRRLLKLAHALRQILRRN